MLIYRWASIIDCRPTINQNRVNVLCLLEDHRCIGVPDMMDLAALHDVWMP